jgi:hypothetical protein
LLQTENLLQTRGIPMTKTLAAAVALLALSSFAGTALADCPAHAAKNTTTTSDKPTGT